PVKQNAMRLFLFLLSLYGLVIVFGVGATLAADTDLSAPATQAQEDAAVEEIIAHIKELFDTIRAAITTEKLTEIIQTAADRNPDVRTFLEQLQSYGILTDINLSPSP